MKKLFFLICCLSSLTAPAQTLTNQQYRSDFDYFWNTINDNYAYFQKKGIENIRRWCNPQYTAKSATSKSTTFFTITG